MSNVPKIPILKKKYKTSFFRKKKSIRVQKITFIIVYNDIKSTFDNQIFESLSLKKKNFFLYYPSHMRNRTKYRKYVKTLLFLILKYGKIKLLIMSSICHQDVASIIELVYTQFN